MGAPERTVKMETSEKMKQQSEDSSTTSATVDAVVDASPKVDQFAWAQFMHDSQYFEFSPKGLNVSPRLDSPSSFQNLSALVQSPMFAGDQWKFLWSPRSTAAGVDSELILPEVETAAAAAAAAPPAPPSVSEQVKSLNLSRLSSSERGPAASATTSCDSEGPCSSEGDVKLGTSCAESTASGDERTRRRKRTPEREPEEELVDDSEAEDLEDSKDHIASKPSRSKQQKVKGARRLREPRIAIKTRTEVDIMEDGYKWRKYGQKPVKNSPHPRNYYRCTTANCPVRKRVERSLEDPGLVVTSYEGTHTHPKVNQPKRTASGSFAPVEAAESLSESLNQLQTRQVQQAAGSSSSNHSFPLTFPGFPPQQLVNRQPCATDNVGLMMAYQIVRLQWELQQKTQQFLNYNAGLQPKTNPFLEPNFALPNMQAMPDFSALMGSSFGDSSTSDSDTELQQRFPKVPEALNSGSLLARRAAQRAGSPLNPNLHSNALKMQQLLAQAMAGLQQAVLSDPQGHVHGGYQDQGQ